MKKPSSVLELGNIGLSVRTATARLRSRGSCGCGAPPALGLLESTTLLPAFIRWANFCRASGAYGRAWSVPAELVRPGNLGGLAERSIWSWVIRRKSGGKPSNHSG